MNFEKKLSKIEEIVQKMEKGDLSLDDALKSFEEGVKLTRECKQLLTEAENKVKLLVSMDHEGNATTKEFNPEEN